MRPKYSSNRYQIIDGLYDNEQYSTETEGYTVYTKLNKNFSNGSTLTADASFDKNRNTEKHATNTLRDENFSLGQTNVIVSANYSFSLGKVNLSVGAQGWFNRMETSQRITNEDYTSNSFSLLPSASVSYAFRDGKSNLSISYYARQFLPRFSQLNPRRIVISDSKVYQGNPYPKPMRFHSLNLEYMLNPNIVFSIRGSKKQLTISKYTSEDNILIETLISEGRSEGFYFSPYYQNTFFRIWTVTLSPSLHYTHYKNPNDAVYNCHYWGWDFSVSSMVEFIPGKRWFLSCSYHYSGKERAPYQHKNAVQDLSVDIMKTFPFGLDVSASMIKKFVYGKERYFTTDTYSYTLLNKNVPVFTLNLSYTFGNRRVRSVRTKTSASYSD